MNVLFLDALEHFYDLTVTISYLAWKFVIIYKNTKLLFLAEVSQGSALVKQMKGETLIKFDQL